jgi:hypothetical protein
LVKLICHPLVSSNNLELNAQIKELEAAFSKAKLASYFQASQEDLINLAIRERSGILSPDKTLRERAVNIGVALASQDLFSAFVGDLAKIMNYKPLELSHKLE